MKQQEIINKLKENQGSTVQNMDIGLTQARIDFASIGAADVAEIGQNPFSTE